MVKWDNSFTVCYTLCNHIVWMPCYRGPNCFGIRTWALSVDDCRGYGHQSMYTTTTPGLVNGRTVSTSGDQAKIVISLKSIL